MFAITVIACVVGIVWGALLVLRGSVVAGCALYLAAAAMFGAEFFQFDAAGFTWSLDRFLLLGLVAAFAVQWRMGGADPKPWGAGEWLLTFFTVLLLISTFTHDWRTLGPEDVPVLNHLVNGYLIPLAIFWLARQAAITQRNVQLVQAVLAGFGVYLVATALLEAGGQWGLVFPRYIADPEVGIHFGRARGPFVQAARFGTYLTTCLAATWIAYAWQARWGRGGQLLVACLAPLYAAAVYFTYTRSVWMGLALALFIILGLTLRGVWRNLALGAMCLALLIGVAAKGESLIAFQREDSAAVTRESTYMRASFAYVSWEMFQDRPLAGFGFGQFPRENSAYLTDQETNLRLEAIRGYVHHNTFLCILVELGLFGFLAFTALLAVWLRQGWALWRDPAAPDWARGHGLLLLAVFAPYSFQLLFRDVSYSPVENSLIFLLAGLASGLRVMFAQPAERVEQAAPPSAFAGASIRA